MNRIRLAAGVLNQTPLDWDGNLRRINAALHLAREDEASVLCLPELCLTGYGCEDTFHSPAMIETAYELLYETVSLSAGLVVSVGLPILWRGTVYNAVALIVDQNLIGFVPKQHLAGDGIHYEPRWFKPWPENTRAELELHGTDYPIGDLLFDVGGIRIGFEICEDAWVGERPGSQLAARGADIILNPSASHFAFGKHHVRKRFVQEGARAFQVAYVYANLVGNESGRAIFDGDAMIAAHGEILMEGERFRFQEASLTAANVDLDLVRLQRTRISSFRPSIQNAEQSTIKVDWKLPTSDKLSSANWIAREPVVENGNASKIQTSNTTTNKISSASTTEANRLAVAQQSRQDGCRVVGERVEEVAGWESAYDEAGTDVQKYEEFTRAVCLGLFDYICKSRSQGVVISLSGGADSAAVAVLSRLAFELAYTQLGACDFYGRLGYRSVSQDGELIAADVHGQSGTLTKTRQQTEVNLSDANLDTAVEPESGDRAFYQFCQTAIRTAYQATRNSGEVTREAARQIAQAIGSTHYELDIDSIVDGYEGLIELAIGRPLSWQQDDIARQNIQARTRSPSIWMFANLFNLLLLSTSNRSESAVGYATMDGDTSGGLSPIAGIDKAFLREWLGWMEKEGPHGLSPIPALQVINRQQPTAELRPAEAQQTDEGDLMPYPVLDQLERWAIRDKKSPEEIFQLLSESHAEILTATRLEWITRFFQLWSRNQWKRERYAPSFHLDDENLDPKTWCRFPILSGGYRRELRQLRERFS